MKVVDTRSDTDNASCPLMAHHQGADQTDNRVRRLTRNQNGAVIDFSDVTSAHPGTGDLNQYLPGPRFGNGALLNTDVAAIVKHNCLHGRRYGHLVFLSFAAPTGRRFT
ncbi:hypothetical protein D806_004660 [Mycolicibacterium smegmatis MKD8]|uniref:Uncharacterized protein n=1 Tax=Mycolicibacterium smegmatis (strain MKD8) TaxID=1214915 RepID=A0A2U9PIA7_MYCSE|nr:hypothetical protein [Mycolicibacterium smegmatis]AWT51459.1 hypothetical protein D806_004660 [Mycolicibacterium smegmatis MKD8]